MVNTGHYWSILVGVVDWNFQVVVTDILGHVLAFIVKRKEKKWNVSSLPNVLIISFSTLTLTSALQSRHLTLVFFSIMKGIIEVFHIRSLDFILTQLQL